MVINIDQFDFENDIKIDNNALDIEWLRHPQLTFNYCCALAEAGEELDRAKENSELVKAELDNVIRSNPEEFLGKDVKVTNPVVEAAILRSKRYKDTFEELMDTRTIHGKLASAVKALDVKKSSLENLVRLMGQQYFSAPKEPRDLSMEYEKKAQQNHSRNKVHERLNSKSKRRTD